MYRFAALFALAALLPAQNTSCGLSGTVLDPAHSVMPNVEIVLTSEDHGFVRTTLTNKDGFFSFPDLTPAGFTLVASSAGFKTYRQTGIVIGSSEQRSLGEIRRFLERTPGAIVICGHDPEQWPRLAAVYD